MQEFPYIPSTDQLEDELQKLVNAKNDFIYAMDKAYKQSSNKTSARVALIISEQSFDEVLYPELLKLKRHIDMRSAVLPKSDMYQEWLDETIPNRSASC